MQQVPEPRGQGKRSFRGSQPARLAGQCPPALRKPSLFLHRTMVWKSPWGRDRRGVRATLANPWLPPGHPRFSARMKLAACPTSLVSQPASQPFAADQHLTQWWPPLCPLCLAARPPPLWPAALRLAPPAWLAPWSAGEPERFVRQHRAHSAWQQPSGWGSAPEAQPIRLAGCSRQADTRRSLQAMTSLFRSPGVWFSHC